MMATPTAELARFVAELKYEDLPPRIRERVKDILLDTLASAMAGRQGDETRQIRALASTLALLLWLPSGDAAGVPSTGDFLPQQRAAAGTRLHADGAAVHPTSISWLHASAPSKGRCSPGVRARREFQ